MNKYEQTPTSGLFSESALAERDAALRNRVPLPEEGYDPRPKVPSNDEERIYFQGAQVPPLSSVLISNSKYLNNPYYREAFAHQALRRHGHDLPPTYVVPMMQRALQEVTDYPRVMQLLIEEKKKRPEFGEWLDRRRITSFASKDLSKYPAGTLGEAIHVLSQQPGIDLEFMSKHRAPDNDLDYIFKRRASLHDIEHLVTGFGPNTAGENALAMANVMSEARYFTPEFAQFMSAGTVWITSAGYNRTALHYHHVLPTYLDAMQLGIVAGKALTQPLYMTDWEDFLDWSLDAISRHLGIQRGPGTGWDWTTEAAAG